MKVTLCLIIQHNEFYYLHVHECWLNPGSFDGMTKYKTICYHYIFGNTVGNMMPAHTQLYQPHVGIIQPHLGIHSSLHGCIRLNQDSYADEIDIPDFSQHNYETQWVLVSLSQIHACILSTQT